MEMIDQEFLYYFYYILRRVDVAISSIGILCSTIALNLIVWLLVVIKPFYEHE